MEGVIASGVGYNLRRMGLVPVGPAKDALPFCHSNTTKTILIVPLWAQSVRGSHPTPVRTKV